MASHMEMLKRLGMEADVDFCCERDRSRVVPEMSIYKGHPAFFAGKG
jgi:phosphosulfolactate phosphohydrolase-like enzyme